MEKREGSRGEWVEKGELRGYYLEEPLQQGCGDPQAATAPSVHH